MTAGPFERAALVYFDRGWTGVLPMRRSVKAPFVSGFHGKTDRYPTREMVKQWVRDYPHANIAIRLPPGIVGIDLDVYHEGNQTLRDLASIHGELPVTWCSTARDDGSGVRLYRADLPEGRQWLDKVGTGIDIVHPGNRYVMAAPSIHPELNLPYRWLSPGGAPGKLPNLEEF